MEAIAHPDGLVRCPWPKQDPLYLAYHDEEWGVPEYNDRALYEKLVLDGFQAGLSWITILRKRDNFRRAFDDFQPDKIARLTPKRVEKLMADPGIVRNRAKIEGAIASARAGLAVMDKGPGFTPLLWNFVDGAPLVSSFRDTAKVPAETDVSRAMSRSCRNAASIFGGRPSSMLSAGGRHGQRPPRDVPSSSRMRGACAFLCRPPGKKPRRRPREDNLESCPMRRQPPPRSCLSKEGKRRAWHACCPDAGSICSTLSARHRSGRHRAWLARVARWNGQTSGPHIFSVAAALAAG